MRKEGGEGPADGKYEGTCFTTVGISETRLVRLRPNEVSISDI